MQIETVFWAFLSAGRSKNSNNSEDDKIVFQFAGAYDIMPKIRECAAALPSYSHDEQMAALATAIEMANKQPVQTTSTINVSFVGVFSEYKMSTRIIRR